MILRTPQNEEFTEERHGYHYSWCFQKMETLDSNTLNDLKDCAEKIEEFNSLLKADQNLNLDEYAAMVRLIYLAQDICGLSLSRELEGK
jgi:hypothetical protein